MHVGVPAVAAAAGTGTPTGIGTTSASLSTILVLLTSSRVCDAWQLRATVHCWDANMRYLLPTRNGFCQPDGGRAPNADDTVPSCYPGDGIINDMLGYVDEGGVENPRIEIGYKLLDAAGETDATRAADDERRVELQTT